MHLWNPPFCGDIDMRIAADGTWFYLGSPIGRPPLVQLFSSILRKDAERYVLVTPVERVGIKVDDAPFLAVEMRVEDGDDDSAFRTNVDDWTSVDAEHPLRFENGAAEGVKPYVRVRGDLWALVKRALFYDLVDAGAGDRGRGLVRRAVGRRCSFRCGGRARSRGCEGARAAPPASPPLEPRRDALHLGQRVLEELLQPGHR